MISWWLFDTVFSAIFRLSKQLEFDKIGGHQMLHNLGQVFNIFFVVESKQ
jgi:hypothetical protein